MKGKETPIYCIRTFRCPNCESRNLKWEKWGFIDDLHVDHPWMDIKFVYSPGVLVYICAYVSRVSNEMAHLVKWMVGKRLWL